MSAGGQPFGATGEPGTCLWCGRKLRTRMRMVDGPEVPGAVLVGKLEHGGWWQAPAKKAGGYSDGFFCGLRCGYQFGKRMAELGDRLRAKIS